jgi:hypothetical protein
MAYAAGDSRASSQPLSYPKAVVAWLLRIDNAMALSGTLRTADCGRAGASSVVVKIETVSVDVLDGELP